MIKKHGMSGTPIYRSWQNMLDRCINPKDVSFKNYGGRGISVCERWHSFENFLADMGEKPEGLTLERKNNDGNYKPSNCKWATWIEQANNRRSKMIKLSKKFVHPLRKWRTDQGLTQTELANKTGHNVGFIHNIEKYKTEPRISEVKQLCDLSEGILKPWDFLEPSEAKNE